MDHNRQDKLDWINTIFVMAITVVTVIITMGVILLI